MIRWGLCCIFREEPIRFRRATAKHLGKLSPDERMHHLSDVCMHNATSLLEALQYCRRNGINAFRINSQILPLKAHSDFAARHSSSSDSGKRRSAVYAS
jgi:UV DNA damage endonuclease